ncbi:hypothetical protein [Bacillus sp. EB01]|uniref:hypothetical protein n=1 Tax=Bacillus sp. EB01 TaxID=1347086 RepID=UPI0005C73A50|nr:hypothetical protein [Bacillus sp. EB01]
MKKVSSLIFLIVAILSINVHFTFANSQELWTKYPDNSAMSFQNADAFYDSVDKEQYIEFKNAKLNIREKTYFQDINSVLSKADKYGTSRTGGEGYHPKRQVYVFVTVSEDGKKHFTAVFDAAKRLISSSSNIERKNPYGS